MDESFSPTIFLYGMALVLAVGKTFTLTIWRTLPKPRPGLRQEMLQAWKNRRLRKQAATSPVQHRRSEQAGDDTLRDDHWVPIAAPSEDTDTTASERSLPSRASRRCSCRRSIIEAVFSSIGGVLTGRSLATDLRSLACFSLMVHPSIIPRLLQTSHRECALDINQVSTLGRHSRNIGRVVFRQQCSVSLANTIGSCADQDSLQSW